MAELGGPTTQSGILYQNTIAALFLGQLCTQGAIPKHKQIVEVRCESIAAVDDIVLLFEDGHREFIQAKETVTPGSTPWKKLWRDIAGQILEPGFQPNGDRLILYVGERRDEFRALRAMAERAQGSTDWSEWQSRITQEHKRIYESIKADMEAVGLETVRHHNLFRRFSIREETLEDLEFAQFRYMPPCNVHPATLFRLLRDRIGEHARIRKGFRAEDLVTSLSVEHEIVFDLSVSQRTTVVQDPPLLRRDRSRPQWFVSSRLKDGCLSAEREAAIELLERTGLIAPWASERHLPAGDYPYESTCLAAAATSDGLLLIIDGELTPFCQREYEAAAKSQKSCFIFIKQGQALDTPADQFVGEQRAKGKNAVRFRNLDELRSLLNVSLQSECARAFHHSQQVRLLTPAPSAKLQ